MKEICASLYKKTGGFIRGVCHPREKFQEQLKAGLNWVRRDMPYPYDAPGQISESYLAFRESCARYLAHGIRTIVVTPYPRKFLQHGVDVKTPDGLAKAESICRQIARDFSDLSVCFQATNEMHIAHFRAPLNSAQGCDFIIACLRGLRAGNPVAPIGHNSLSLEWEPYCLKIAQEAPSDYIGLDCYDGTWSAGGPESYIEKIDMIYERLHMPVVVMEFGFASKGKSDGITREMATAYFRDRGAESLERALETPALLEKALPRPLWDIAQELAPEDLPEAVMAWLPHLLKAWPMPGAIPHTEEGQAAFFAQLLPMLIAHPAVGGAVIYCWQDSEACFLCKATDCPCETAWGLTRFDGTPKPALAAIEQVYQKA